MEWTVDITQHKLELRHFHKRKHGTSVLKNKHLESIRLRKGHSEKTEKNRKHC